MMNPSYDHFQPGSPGVPAQPIVPLEASTSAGFSPPMSIGARRPVLVATTPGASQQTGSLQIDPISLLRALQRRWMIAAPLGIVLGVVAAAVVWFMIPPSKFTASSRLLVAQSPPRFMYGTRETSSDYALFRQTQTVLIKSQKVLDTALKHPKVQSLDDLHKLEDVHEWVRQNLNISFPNGSEILELSMTGQNPVVLMTVVNSVTDAYLNEVVDVDYNARLTRLEKLRTFWKTFKDELLKKRANLRQLISTVGGGDKLTIGIRKQMEDERQSSVRAALIKVQAELMQAETELEALASAPQESDEVLLSEIRAKVDEELDKDPELIDRAAKIEELQTAYKALAGAARNPGNDAAGLRIRRELDSEQKALVARAKAIRPAIEKALLQGSETRDPDGLKSLRSQIALLKRFEAKYLDEISKIKEERTDLNRSTFDLGFLQTEVELDEKAAREMGDEIQHAEIELQQAPPRIQSLEKALLPRTKDKDKRPLMASVAGLGVFAFIALAIGFWECQAKRITSVDEVAGGLGLTIVGSIPQLPNPRRSLTAAPAAASPRQVKWNNILIESVDATRTMLLRAAQADSLRTIMITSASVGEGKSTLSSHLATSLARSGRRTLLIDCDLRRPIAHRVYEIPLSPGFCEYLRGELPFESIIRETVMPNLWLAPAGLCDESALAELSQHDLSGVFNALQATYDYIIVDSSPVLPVIDATVIGQHVDAVILSIMNDHSRVPEVQESYELLSNLGIRVLGAVMAGTKAKRYYHLSYAYHGVPRSPEA